MARDLRPSFRALFAESELGRLRFDPVTLEHPQDHQIRVVF
jgi:hypothetical protein